MLLSTSSSAGERDFFQVINSNTESQNSDPPTNATFSGWLQERVTIGLGAPARTGFPFSRSWSGLSGFETSLFLKLDGRLPQSSSHQMEYRLSAKLSHEAIYSWKGRDQFSRDEVDEHESRYLLRDAYLETSLGKQAWVRIGNQIVAWGEAEGITIVDVINPKDLETFGQARLEELRIQVPAGLFEWSNQGWLVNIVVTERAGANRLALANNEFDPSIALRTSGVGIVKYGPRRELEYATRIGRFMHNGDVALILARVNSDQYHTSSYDPITNSLSLSQERISVAGVVANHVDGAWLYTTEMGIHEGKRFPPAPITNNPVWVEGNEMLGMLAAEYTGFPNVSIRCEATYSNIRDHSAVFGTPSTQTGFNTTFRWDMFHERLHLISYFSRQLSMRDMTLRVSAEYEWNDTVSTEIKGVFYHSGDNDSFMYAYRKNDAVIATVRLKF